MNNDLFLKIANLESYILSDVHGKFHREGKLNAFDFFCIVIWKANRAKSKIAKRLITRGDTLEQAVHKLTSVIFSAKTDKERMQIMITNYRFRLPMASAVLSILYPNDFTVYDVRVCATLPKYEGLGQIINFENLWKQYVEYLEDVRKFDPRDFSLRERDKMLWGKSFFEDLNRDIETEFQREVGSTTSEND